MARLGWFVVLGLIATPFAACGPDAKPEPPCEGATFNLAVTAESDRPLPPDTRLNVRYGGNRDGEPYQLGQTPAPQAVFCDEDTSQGGSPSQTGQEVDGAAGAAGAGGGSAGAPSTASGVWALRCRLYTQGPARIDVSATGYEPIDGQDLLLTGKKRCQVDVKVELKRLLDAGSE